MDSSDEIKRLQQERKDRVPLNVKKAEFDSDIYGQASAFSREIVDDVEDVVDTFRPAAGGSHPATLAAANAANRIAQQMKSADGEGEDAAVAATLEALQRETSGKINTKIADRENEYQARRRNRQLSPERGGDVFKGEDSARSYKDIMLAQQLEREKDALLRKAVRVEQEKAEEEARAAAEGGAAGVGEKKRRRWDDSAAGETSAPPTGSQPRSPNGSGVTSGSVASSVTAVSDWDAPAAAKGKKNRWDATPDVASGAVAASSGWETPSVASGGAGGAVTRKRSRWDETPVVSAGAAIAATPLVTGGGFDGMVTPAYDASGANRTIIPLTGELASQMRWEKEMEDRNRPLTDDELDAMFPTKGYRILEPPANYQPVRIARANLLATPTPQGGAVGFSIPQTPALSDYGVPIAAQADIGGVPIVKQDDMQFFGKLMEAKDTDELTSEEIKERRIMSLLLKIKNGTPQQRKSAMRNITEKARELGAGPLFNQILPILMSPSLEDQERHLLVKVIDRVLYKLDDLVRPYVRKILTVIQPMLIDVDYYARVEGREIISNLSKAAGLATMISTMRPDIDNLDEYVRNTTARAFAVVASALGIPALLPFLKAVCQSRKSWQARHTGVKIVQQIAILMGCAVLPHLKMLVEIVKGGLEDEQQKVRTITGLAIGALAEAAYPYGIESFEAVLEPLWRGVRDHRGKGLAAFLKAVGHIIPLMDAQYANYYTKEVMPIVRREFQSPDEEMKKIVLAVVAQCVKADGVDAAYVRSDILPEFFKHFWVRRMALDQRNAKPLVETTVELANKVGASDMLAPRPGGAGPGLVDFLHDESEPFRQMAMSAIEKIIQNLGAADVDPRLEESMVDGILYAFQEQNTEDSNAVMTGFGTVVNALGVRVKPYLPQICGTIRWRLNNKVAKVRMQAADLVSRIAVVMKTCNEEAKLGHLGIVLYECLGEEYPEVLGSILGGLKAIVNVIGMGSMQPPIKDLLPRLTPILKNRHEKVQENCIAEGTLVALADGTSRAIEDIRVGDLVAAPVADGGHVGMLPAQRVTRVLDNGVRQCVAVVFEDGRELVCTPDHRLMRADGQWQTAAELEVGHTQVCVAAGCVAPPLQPRPSDAAWSLVAGSVEVDVRTPASCEKALAFARVVGCVVGAGLFTPTQGFQVTLRSTLDVDAFCRDAAMLEAVPPRVVEDVAAHQRSFAVFPHSVLSTAIAAVPGLRTPATRSKCVVAALPEFVTDPATPKAFLREFCAAVFGSSSSASVSGSLAYSVVAKGGLRAETAAHAMMHNLLGALTRLGVDTTGYSVRDSHSNVVLDLPNSVSFAQHVGLRYCVEKSARLGAASVCAAVNRQLRTDGVTAKALSDAAVEERELMAPISPCDGDVAPMFSLRVVERRIVGERRVYDLTVPGPDAFFAAGVAVHNCIDLVGRIADRGADMVSPREWMRICFELLELLNAHKKAIRRATVNTFGYIAKAIGPQDVVETLLNNLKVQERQNRVCTTIAIAIVAETCQPFTVLPALMNEYRTPEQNVQNGVLKTLSFLFEYIGEMAKDYINAVVPLFEDALMDRDLIHRQTASFAIKHMGLGVVGLGCEDALAHLMNFVWPNIFESSPHVVEAVYGSVEAFRCSLGVQRVLLFIWQGLFHPARRVRERYWVLYNNQYVNAVDAMTSCYPRIPDDEHNSYNRSYVDLFL